MKDIKDYLHLYLGCECHFGYIDRIGRLAGIDERYGWQIFYPGNPIVPYRFVRPELIKLLLRPLSDMTEEEATEIAIIMYGQPDSVKWRTEDKGSYFNVYRKYYSESFVIDKASGDIDRYSKEDGDLELQTTLQHHFITRYMLSKGFDLFGLIDARLAIDKTKMV